LFCSFNQQTLLTQYANLKFKKNKQRTIFFENIPHSSEFFVETLVLFHFGFKLFLVPAIALKPLFLFGAFFHFPQPVGHFWVLKIYSKLFGPLDN